MRNAVGNILLQSSPVDPANFAAQPRQGFYTTATQRVYGVGAVSNTIFIEVAEPLAYRRRATRAAAAPLLLPPMILIPLSLIGIWLFVRHSLRSVVTWRDAIEARGAGDLSPVEDRPLPTEIAPITSAVNDLMDRLRRTLEAERSFTANSAHELRTPLATLLAQIQRLQRETPDERVRDRAVQIEDTLHGLVRLSEKLMQLAKAESGGLLAAAPQDLVAVLAHIVDDFRHTAGDRLSVTLPESETVPSIIDPDAFATLTHNLMENALKHGATDQPAEI